MNLTRDRVRSIGWFAVLTVCGALVLALTFRVNAVKSQVRLAERQIVALRQDKMLLETEFETRANQQQLKALNEVEFGYEAPTAGQYLESERQLAAYGKARAPGAPEPIRVASAASPAESDSGFPAMVSPLTGRVEAAASNGAVPRQPTNAAGLQDRLSHVGDAPAAKPQPVKGARSE
ncbi:MAG: hypothetical protein KGL44_10505 [Sphingomonadales bacterium]|nr:hypothetical protein [Sphingomonadales bacterium]